MDMVCGLKVPVERLIIFLARGKVSMILCICYHDISIIVEMYMNTVGITTNKP